MKFSPAVVHLILAFVVLLLCMGIYPFIANGDGSNFAVMVLLILGLAAYFFLYARLLQIRLDGSRRIYGSFLWIVSALVASLLYVPIYGLLVGNPETASTLGTTITTGISGLIFAGLNVLFVELVAARR